MKPAFSNIARTFDMVYSLTWYRYIGCLPRRSLNLRKREAMFGVVRIRYLPGLSDMFISERTWGT
jgi:hypothetical protein